MSRPIPPELEALREATRASRGYWTKAKRVSDDHRAAMTETERKNLRYGPDPTLLERLCEAEREFTASFNPGRTGW